MKLKYNFEIMEIDDEKVAVPIGDNSEEFHGIIKLNETAAKVIELLQDNKSKEEMIDIFCNTYDTDKESIENYVNAYIDELKKEGILD